MGYTVYIRGGDAWKIDHIDEKLANISSPEDPFSYVLSDALWRFQMDKRALKLVKKIYGGGENEAH